MGPDAMILVVWMLSLKPTFSLSSLHFIKRLFSSPLLSAQPLCLLLNPYLTPKDIRKYLINPPLLNIQKTKIVAFSLITSWQIGGETMETVRDFILGGSKITADGDCSHENKRHFLLGRKVMTNLDSILKSRDITLLTKVHLIKVSNCGVGKDSWESVGLQGDPTSPS